MQREPMTFVLAADAGGEPVADYVNKILLLGTSNKFVFQYDVAQARVDIIPNENISRLIVGDATGEQPEEPPALK